MQGFKRITAQVSRYLLAALFIFSGFVKSIDPMGSAIKFTEYFHAFGLGFMEPLTLPLAIILSGLELLLGLCLLLGIRPKFTTGLALVFMCGFTALTLYSAIFNPVSDCGCFGDAVKLSNWETFYKNIFLLVAAILAYLYFKKQTVGNRPKDIPLIVLLAVFSFGLGVYSVRSLPMFDFLPYKAGVNIPKAMHVPHNALADEYAVTLTYRNRETGKKQVFKPEDPAWQDSSVWEYVGSNAKLVKKGFRPAIENFAVFRGDDDVTEQLLSDTSHTVILSVRNPDKISPRQLEKLESVVGFALRNNYRLICFTSGSVEETEDFLARHFSYRILVYTIDDVTLKSFVRADTGVIILKKGTILAKWNINDTPRLQDKSMDVVLSMMKSRTSRIHNGVFLFFVLIAYGAYKTGKRTND